MWFAALCSQRAVTYVQHLDWPEWKASEPTQLHISQQWLYHPSSNIGPERCKQGSANLECDPDKPSQQWIHCFHNAILDLSSRRNSTRLKHIFWGNFWCDSWKPCLGNQPVIWWVLSQTNSLSISRVMILENWDWISMGNQAQIFAMPVHILGVRPLSHALQIVEFLISILTKHARPTKGPELFAPF